MEIAEYSKENKIHKEPEFALWVPSALKCINVMIRKAAMRVRKKIKFGIYIHATYNEAVAMYRIIGNTYWQDSTKK